MNKKAVLKDLIIIISIYIIYYLIWLIIGNKDMNVSILEVILMRNSKFYLFPWLVRNNLYWISLIISIIGILLSKKYFSYILCLVSTIGILIGELLGPNPSSPTGHTHNGWWICILLVLIGMIVGALIEKYLDKAKK